MFNIFDKHVQDLTFKILKLKDKTLKLQKSNVEIQMLYVFLWASSPAVRDRQIGQRRGTWCLAAQTGTMTRGAMDGVALRGRGEEDEW